MDYVGVAVATLEAAGINTFFIETASRTVYMLGLMRLIHYLGLPASEVVGDEVRYKNWHLIEGLPRNWRLD
jgi:hypothetical protein